MPPPSNNSTLLRAQLALIGKQAQGKPFEIALRIESESSDTKRVWQIPAHRLPLDDFTLDETWQNFEIKG